MSYDEELKPEAENDTPLRAGLPAWTYGNAELLELEYQRVILPSWQIACHVSDVAAPGSYFTLQLMRDSILIVRDETGALRAFQNVCRHRASKLLEGEGRCKKRIICPYHGWNYRLDGRLAAVPSEASFPGLVKEDHGLRQVDLEVLHGFIFVRVATADDPEGGPSVADIWGDFAKLLAPYDIPSMERLEESWEDIWEVNWKVAIDNNLENYHIPIGHPGYHRMLDNDLLGEANAHGVAYSISRMKDRPSSNWSERHYQALSGKALSHLSGERAKRWMFFSMPPNLGIDVYPDCVDFFQILPLGPKRSKVRTLVYGHADSRREMRALRYLNGRINGQVAAEDFQLCHRVQQGLGSHGYELGPLSEYETSVRHFHDLIHEAVPGSRLPEPPAPGELVKLDREHYQD
ncbi:aromatic ring-hydroxylating dioxygenase subunit alpha [Limibacillus sp. MBR-115]|jgi:phenylpropionate dioxygenase-like ring-hydroxylating dioxygenase large terminal subunit|uniref:aromatic ring-hydroxylating oxygenase subunit alpha n=1 Tax=Limibacillus sp. MBR-115 TaxID=3156465 RepID=UPI00339383A2